MTENRVPHRLGEDIIVHMQDLRKTGTTYMGIRDHVREEHDVTLSLSTVQYWTDDKYRKTMREKNLENYHKRKRT